MTLSIVETYSVGDYAEYEVFECSDCGETQTHLSGADPCCCPCEFRNEGKGDE